MKYYLYAISKYATFSGRARRKEFWIFILLHVFFSLVASSLDYLFGSLYLPAGFGMIYLIYHIVTFLPSLSVTVRRLHDVGKSGEMVFILLIPVIGAIWLLGLLCMPGQEEINFYGDRSYSLPV